MLVYSLENDWAISNVLSVEQSSIKNNSQFLYVWFSTLFIVSERKASELYMGVIIETEGVIWNSN
jgi:hypothetical protein